MPIYRGSCHCGRVRFEFETDIDELTTCDCSLCRRKNALMARAHESRFKILSGPDSVALYQWNLRIAEHYFCSRCGIYTFHKKRSQPDHYGINVYCIEDFSTDGIPVRETEGVGMTVAGEGARAAWTGPREPG